MSPNQGRKKKQFHWNYVYVCVWMCHCSLQVYKWGWSYLLTKCGDPPSTRMQSAIVANWAILCWDSLFLPKNVIHHLGGDEESASWVEGGESKLHLHVVKTQRYPPWVAKIQSASRILTAPKQSKEKHGTGTPEKVSAWRIAKRTIHWRKNAFL